MKPCPLCGCKKAEQRDCGYSSFNPVWYECPDCGFKVNVFMAGKADVSAKTWVEGCILAETIIGLPAKQRKILGYEEAYKSMMKKKKSCN
jgi:hypothetical protein